MKPRVSRPAERSRPRSRRRVAQEADDKGPSTFDHFPRVRLRAGAVPIPSGVALDSVVDIPKDESDELALCSRFARPLSAVLLAGRFRGSLGTTLYSAPRPHASPVITSRRHLSSFRSRSKASGCDDDGRLATQRRETLLISARLTRNAFRTPFRSGVERHRVAIEVGQRAVLRRPLLPASGFALCCSETRLELRRRLQSVRPSEWRNIGNGRFLT